MDEYSLTDLLLFITTFQSKYLVTVKYCHFEDSRPVIFKDKVGRKTTRHLKHSLHGPLQKMDLTIINTIWIR